MDDVITRAADALEWLSERYRRQLPGNRDMEADHRAMVALAQELRSMGWVSVEERLPEPNTRVLIICPDMWGRDLRGKMEPRAHFGEYTPRYSASDWRPESTNGGPWTVTHWMPIPTLPTTTRTNHER